MPKQKSVKVSRQELKNRIESALEEADAARLRGLERIVSVRKARARALERGIARRAARGGEDDPAARRAKRRLERDRMATEELEPLRIATAHRLREVDPSTATIQGAVLDEHNRGVQGAKVTIVNTDGTSLPDAPTVTTDRDGYYELRLPPELLETELLVAVGAGVRRRVLKESKIELRAGEARFVVGRPAGVERITRIDREQPPGPGEGRRYKLEDIEGVGRASAGKLRAAGIESIKAVVEAPPELLVEILGPRVDVEKVKKSATELLRKERERHG